MGIEELSRSVLFEIVGPQGNVEESYTLVIPPMSWRVIAPARVAVSKTFGGSFIDDYGEDNEMITITGHSGTARAYTTYRTQGKANQHPTIQVETYNSQVGSETYNGRDAFYTFRNSIMRYRAREGYEKRDLYVYDLYDSQSYICVLLDFILDRTIQYPFRYPYVINLFVRQRLDEQRPPPPPIFRRARGRRADVPKRTPAQRVLDSRVNSLNG